MFTTVKCTTSILCSISQEKNKFQNLSFINALFISLVIRKCNHLIMSRQLEIVLLALMLGLSVSLMFINLSLMAVNTIVYQARRRRGTSLLVSGNCSCAICDKTRKRRQSNPKRKYWIRPGRTSLWWDNFVSSMTVAEEWRENFRMSRESFMNLCDPLRPFLVKEVSCFRKPVSVEPETQG